MKKYFDNATPDEKANIKLVCEKIEDRQIYCLVDNNCKRMQIVAPVGQPGIGYAILNYTHHFIKFGLYRATRDKEAIAIGSSAPTPWQTSSIILYRFWDAAVDAGIHTPSRQVLRGEGWPVIFV